MAIDYVPPTMPEPPYRALLLGSAMPGWYEASDRERSEKLIPRMTALMDEWEALGARLIASFDDDLFVAGFPAGLQYSIYLLFEVDRLDALVAMMQSLRQTVDGVRLDNYLRFEARVGRPLFFAPDGPIRSPSARG
jgi:hypothetical protein